MLLFQLKQLKYTLRIITTGVIVLAIIIVTYSNCEDRGNIVTSLELSRMGRKHKQSAIQT